MGPLPGGSGNVATITTKVGDIPTLQWGRFPEEAEIGECVGCQAAIDAELQWGRFPEEAEIPGPTAGPTGQGGFNGAASRRKRK